MPSFAREGLDRLLAANPEMDLAKIDGQPERPATTTRDYSGAPLRETLHQPAGPWVCVDFEGGDQYAIWKHTGAVYRVGKDGAVEDDPVFDHIL